MCELDLDLAQLDGNVSICSDIDSRPNTYYKDNKRRNKMAAVAHHLPVVTVSNVRSLFPKIRNIRTDMLEREVDVNLCCEIFEKADNKKQREEIEKMLEIDGFKYFSTPRPRGKRGGGAGIIVSTKKFKVEKLEIQIPHKLEIVWALAKPKHTDAHFQNIVLCSFYSPPRSKLRDKLKDHIVGTLQILTTKYGECAIFCGGDKNRMDISSLTNNNLKLKQIVQLPTRKGAILDVCLTNCYAYYSTPVIIPPVQPDIPGQGVASDHSVPLCVPHTNPHNPPARVYRTVISRPLPDSKIRQFGQWITRVSWDNINSSDDPTKQVEIFENTMTQKLDDIFPKKITKLCNQDKPFMTSELKALKRKRMREYVANGKSIKYLRLKKEFKEKFEKEGEAFLRKNIDNLKVTNLGQAYNILKRMGAKPGDGDEKSTFTLPSHENFTPLEAANKIADHFSKISKEFPHLDSKILPDRVKAKLANPESESKVPVIMEHQVYDKIKSANKPKSGVPGDLPRKLVSEFSPEISVPICKIFNSVISHAKQGAVKWPTPWKQEFGIPLQKNPDPKCEDDLRVISLTSFFSKVLEKFVLQWLMFYIGEKIDPKQFGGLKGNSISHYMIELVNYILQNQDYNLPIAVLLCAVDFSKAFNRINHNLIITKLSDMGVPGWLLNIVMGFLAERVLVVSYKGAMSDIKGLPGGGPQGTLLGLLLFLILINLCGEQDFKEIGSDITKPKRNFTPSSFHAKFVDDMTIAEAFNIKESVLPDPHRELPDTFHARLGLKLDPNKSKVYEQIFKIKEYSEANEMKLNLTKTKFMLFNPTVNYDFVPNLTVDNVNLETSEEMKLLGLTISSDLSWKSNTSDMVQRAYKKLWIIKRLKKQGANLSDLVDIYIKQIRSILEFGVPVWNSALTQEEVVEIERVQKSFLHIALKHEYQNYQSALSVTNLDSLVKRRLKLCTKFALKASKHNKHRKWFSKTKPGQSTRHKKPEYQIPMCRLARTEKGPIPYLTNLLNSK